MKKEKAASLLDRIATWLLSPLPLIICFFGGMGIGIAFFR